jgi:hypothetical protein
MPEYLAPGVYVEEIPAQKSIEGVSTTVTGFIGPTRYGPPEGDPELLTSYIDFNFIFGGVDQLAFSEGVQDNYMANAARAFFDNGGTKLYVVRVYGRSNPLDHDEGKAWTSIGSLAPLTLRSRFPGQAGNMRVVFAVRASPNLLVGSVGSARANSIGAHDVVYVHGSGAIASGLWDVADDGVSLSQEGGTAHPISSLDPSIARVFRLSITVRVLRNGQFEAEETWTDLAPNPAGDNALTAFFTATPDSRQRQLTIPFAIEGVAPNTTGAQLIAQLFGNDFVATTLPSTLDPPAPSSLPGSLPGSQIPRQPTLADLEVTHQLQHGNDGHLPPPDQYAGLQAFRDPNTGQLRPASGLEAMADIDEISIIAAPGLTHGYTGDNIGRVDAIIQEIITHCQVRMKYRVAVLDSPNNEILSEVQAFRGKFDSTHAALYYPWPKIIDPTDIAGRREIVVPPSGFVAGVYARSDVAHGVSKAPANEIPFGAIDLELLLNKSQQEILNPLGINCLRFFPDRGFRIWGARTISSDPEWKYINVRRYFAYVEHSIDKGTQWAVFEKNDDTTWANVQRTVYDFLYNEWRNDALLGAKPEQAFFVRCDRSTMTQNDIDNGRLICLIGIAPIKPAEFVIFRIGQLTADAVTR